MTEKTIEAGEVEIGDPESLFDELGTPTAEEVRGAIRAMWETWKIDVDINTFKEQFLVGIVPALKSENMHMVSYETVGYILEFDRRGQEIKEMKEAIASLPTPWGREAFTMHALMSKLSSDSFREKFLPYSRNKTYWKFAREIMVYKSEIQAKYGVRPSGMFAQTLGIREAGLTRGSLQHDDQRKDQYPLSESSASCRLVSLSRPSLALLGSVPFCEDFFRLWLHVHKNHRSASHHFYKQLKAAVLNSSFRKIASHVGYLSHSCTIYDSISQASKYVLRKIFSSVEEEKLIGFLLELEKKTSEADASGWPRSHPIQFDYERISEMIRIVFMGSIRANKFFFNTVFGSVPKCSPSTELEKFCRFKMCLIHAMSQRTDLWYMINLALSGSSTASRVDLRKKVPISGSYVSRERVKLGDVSTFAIYQFSQAWTSPSSTQALVEIVDAHPTIFMNQTLPCMITFEACGMKGVEAIRGLGDVISEKCSVDPVHPCIQMLTRSPVLRADALQPLPPAASASAPAPAPASVTRSDQALLEGPVHGVVRSPSRKTAPSSGAVTPRRHPPVPSPPKRPSGVSQPQPSSKDAPHEPISSYVPSQPSYMGGPNPASMQPARKKPVGPDAATEEPAIRVERNAVVGGSLLSLTGIPLSRGAEPPPSVPATEAATSSNGPSTGSAGGSAALILETAVRASLSYSGQPVKHTQPGSNRNLSGGYTRVKSTKNWYVGGDRRSNFRSFGNALPLPSLPRPKSPGRPQSLSRERVHDDSLVPVDGEKEVTSQEEEGEAEGARVEAEAVGSRADISDKARGGKRAEEEEYDSSSSEENELGEGEGEGFTVEEVEDDKDEEKGEEEDEEEDEDDEEYQPSKKYRTVSRSKRSTRPKAPTAPEYAEEGEESDCSDSSSSSDGSSSDSEEDGNEGGGGGAAAAGETGREMEHTDTDSNVVDKIHILPLPEEGNTTMSVSDSYKYLNVIVAVKKEPSEPYKFCIIRKVSPKGLMMAIEGTMPMGESSQPVSKKRARMNSRLAEEEARSQPVSTKPCTWYCFNKKSPGVYVIPMANHLQKVHFHAYLPIELYKTYMKQAIFCSKPEANGVEYYGVLSTEPTTNEQRRSVALFYLLSAYNRREGVWFCVSNVCKSRCEELKIRLSSIHKTKSSPNVEKISWLNQRGQTGEYICRKTPPVVRTQSLYVWNDRSRVPYYSPSVMKAFTKVAGSRSQVIIQCISSEFSAADLAVIEPYMPDHITYEMVDMRNICCFYVRETDRIVFGSLEHSSVRDDDKQEAIIRGRIVAEDKKETRIIPYHHSLTITESTLLKCIEEEDFVDEDGKIYAEYVKSCMKFLIGFPVDPSHYAPSLSLGD